MVHKYNLSEASLGTYFGFIGLWIVITQAFILRLVTKKYSEKQILKVSVLLVAVAIAFVPFMGTLMAQYLLIPIIAIPQGLSMANMTSLISKKVSPLKQGAALGINGSLAAFSQGIIPTVAGIITSIFGVTAPFILGGILIFFSWYNLIKRTK